MGTFGIKLLGIMLYYRYSNLTIIFIYRWQVIFVECVCNLLF